MIHSIYPIIIALQIFCIYHAYTNRTDAKWYIIVLFFPFIGSLIYLFVHFFNRSNIDQVSEGVKSTLVKNYTLDKLEKETKITGTVSNRIRFGEELMKAGNLTRARDVFASCLEGVHHDDTQVLLKLTEVNYELKDYDEVIKLENKLNDKKEFQYSNERCAMAWSHYHLNNLDRANEIFKDMNVNFSNYEFRIEYAYFLSLIGESQKAQELFYTLNDEIDSMEAYEKRLKKPIIKQLKGLKNKIF